jgi:hypothetical protein
LCLLQPLYELVEIMVGSLVEFLGGKLSDLAGLVMWLGLPRLRVLCIWHDTIHTH